jgi:hypothetical protein
MKIPVFVSCPTSLSPSQEAARTVIIRQLDDNDLEARALGRSDYPTELPLREVLLIARHCSGGIILGFEQFRASSGLKKPGTPAEQQISTSIPFPTAWNHLESGILFGLHLPVLVLGFPRARSDTGPRGSYRGAAMWRDWAGWNNGAASPLCPCRFHFDVSAHEIDFTRRQSPGRSDGLRGRKRRRAPTSCNRKSYSACSGPDALQFNQDGVTSTTSTFVASWTSHLSDAELRPRCGRSCPTSRRLSRATTIGCPIAIVPNRRLGRGSS